MRLDIGQIAKAANDYGVWDCMQTMALISGVSFLFIPRRSVPDLNFFIHRTRDDSNYPLKISVEIDNRTGRSVVLSSMYFVIGKSGLRPDKKGQQDTQTGKLVLNFPGQDASWLTEPNFLLRHRERVKTWVPLDPTHKDEEVENALRTQTTGKLICNCTWVETKFGTHKLVQKV